MSDRIAVMHAGRVEQLGTPEELYERPRRGSWPTSSARPTCCAASSTADGRVRLETGELVPGRRTTASPPGDRVEISVRPESIAPRARRGRGRASRPGSSRRPTSAPTSRTSSARRAGPACTVLAPKTGPRLPVGSDVAVTWHAADALVLGGGPRQHQEETAMTHRHDGSSIDLERALVRYMAERRITRRDLLERIALLGGAAALAPVIAACTGAQATPPPAASASGGAAAPSARTVGRRIGRSVERPDPRADARPLPRGRAVHLQLGRLHGRRRHPVVRGEVRRSRSRTDFFDNYDTMLRQDRPGRRRLRHHVPDSIDIPALLQRRPRSSRSTCRSSPTSPTSAPSGRTRATTRATPTRSRTCGGRPASPTTRRRSTEKLTSWNALWDAQYAQHIAVLDDLREAFAAALFRLGLDPNTTNDADLDEALACSRSRSRSSASTRPTTSASSRAATPGSRTPGARTCTRSTRSARRSSSTSRRRAASAAPTRRSCSPTRKHPVAAQLFINHLLDAQVSATNTNYIGYMGPNAAAKEFIEPDILEDPTVNPDQAVVELSLGRAPRPRRGPRQVRLPAGRRSAAGA